MIDKDTHRFLALLADSKEHHMLEVIKFGSVLLKRSERETEQFFKRRLLSNGWVKRMWKSYEPRTDYYMLTDKGDNLFREVQISRVLRAGEGNDKLLDHFRNFDRTVHGRHGANALGEHITEAKMYGN